MVIMFHLLTTELFSTIGLSIDDMCCCIAIHVLIVDSDADTFPDLKL